MSAFRPTDDLLKDAQEYITFKFFSIPAPPNHHKFIGHENLIFMVSFRDIDALHEFRKFKEEIFEPPEIVEAIPHHAGNKYLIQDELDKHEISIDEVSFIFAADARKFFHIRNLKTLISIHTVQRKLQTIKHGSTIQQGNHNYDDEAM